MRGGGLCVRPTRAPFSWMKSEPCRLRSSQAAAFLGPDGNLSGWQHHRNSDGYSIDFSNQYPLKRQRKDGCVLCRSAVPHQHHGGLLAGPAGAAAEPQAKNLADQELEIIRAAYESNSGNISAIAAD